MKRFLPLIVAAFVPLAASAMHRLMATVVLPSPASALVTSTRFNFPLTAARRSTRLIYW